jgi:hypothetical protein
VPTIKKLIYRAEDDQNPLMKYETVLNSFKQEDITDDIVEDWLVDEIEKHYLEEIPYSQSSQSLTRQSLPNLKGRD